MRGSIDLVTLGVEVLIPAVIGPGNFVPYIELDQFVAGDEFVIRQYIDINGEGDPKIGNTATITFQDIVDSGDEGFLLDPFNLESLQEGTVGVTMIAQTTALPRPVGWRMTNIATAA